LEKIIIAMREKVSYNKNYISKSLEDFFRSCRNPKTYESFLLPWERKMIRDCLSAQKTYGKLTTPRWKCIMQIYHKYKEKKINDSNY